MSIRQVYLFSVFLHVMAAIVWVGGIAFFSVVLVPWLRNEEAPAKRVALHQLAVRFRPVGWVCFGILLVTGTFNLWTRGVRLESFVRPEWLASAMGRAVVTKLGLFVVVVTLSAVHDFVVGPRAVRAMQSGASGVEVTAIRRRASWMGRVNAVLAVALVATAVSIVRGCAL